MSVTVEQIKGVKPTALSDTEISTLIAMATRQASSVLSGSTLTAAETDDIIIWLTAHLIAIGLERQTQEERVDDVWVVHQGTFGEGLRGTTYGQMVLALDYSGSFARTMNKKIRIKAIPQDPNSPTHDVV